jgi:hypothetical protein
MSLTISITDPTQLDQKELNALVGFFVALGGVVPVSAEGGDTPTDAEIVTIARRVAQVHVAVEHDIDYRSPESKKTAPVASEVIDMVHGSDMAKIQSEFRHVTINGKEQGADYVVSGQTVTLLPEPSDVISSERSGTLAQAAGETLAVNLVEAFGGAPVVELSTRHSHPMTDEGTILTEPVWPFPASTGVELDINRLPWDSRIHASTKTKNADGSWRNRKGVDKTVLATVEAELKQTMGASGVPVSVATVPVVPPVVSVPTPPPAAPIAPVAPAAPVAPPVASVPTPPNADPFKAFTARVTPMIARKEILPPQLQAIAAELGLPHIGGLQARHDLIPAAIAAVERLVAGV